jgi:hypothetical protein
VEEFCELMGLQYHKIKEKFPNKFNQGGRGNIGIFMSNVKARVGYGDV